MKRLIEYAAVIGVPLLIAYAAIGFGLRPLTAAGLGAVGFFLTITFFGHVEGESEHPDEREMHRPDEFWTSERD